MSTRSAKISVNTSVNDMRFARDMLSQKYPRDIERQQVLLHENMIDPNAGIPLTNAIVSSVGRRLQPPHNPHFHLFNRAHLINTAIEAGVWNPLLGINNILPIPTVIEIYYN